MSDYNHIPEAPPQLNDARQQYTATLLAARWQIFQGFRGSPDDHQRIATSAEGYTTAFREHLLGSIAIRNEVATAAQKQTASTITLSEIEQRRQSITDGAAKNPVDLYASFELVLAVDSVATAGANIGLAHYPTAIGSSAVAAASYFSYKYRKHADTSLTITDNALTARFLQTLSNQELEPDMCMDIFSATLDSERMAALDVATRALRARTYTPFGYARLLAYKFRQRRANAKQN